MKNFLIILIGVTSLFLTSCKSTATRNPSQPAVQRVPAKFDFSPPTRAQVASANISIAIVKPIYIGENPEYFVPPFNEMASSMGNDFEELLTAKGFTVRGPFGSRDEMVYNDKINSSFVLEIGIELKPQYNRKFSTKTKADLGSILNPYSKLTYTTSHKMSGEITLSGNLVINAKSSQYGELIWKKNIALDASSFTYNGSLTWTGDVPTMADELKQDNLVYNTLSTELEKFYLKSLALAWQQIDPAEMKSVGEQAKKADKKNN
jgi:hypothetical protein